MLKKASAGALAEPLNWVVSTTADLVAAQLVATGGSRTRQPDLECAVPRGHLPVEPSPFAAFGEAGMVFFDQSGNRHLYRRRCGDDWQYFLKGAEPAGWEQLDDLAMRCLPVVVLAMIGGDGLFLLPWVLS